jgi:hypothetical protein
LFNKFSVPFNFCICVLETHAYAFTKKLKTATKMPAVVTEENANKTLVFSLLSLSVDWDQIVAKSTPVCGRESLGSWQGYGSPFCIN